MKLSGSLCDFTLYLIVAGVLYLAAAADGANEFRTCYNTSIEMHCFDLQYDTTKNNWLTASFDNARERCNGLNSNLIIIKDEETNIIVQNFIYYSSSVIGNQYVWMDAYRISDYNNTHTWHWVNSTLPNIQNLEFSPSEGNSWYVESLEFRSQNGRFYLRSQQPHFQNSYVCEYPVSKCSSSGLNVLQVADRCYVAVKALVTWYEARNWCLKDGGDLASFANVTSINFTSWLGPDPNVRYWIGLRFAWYIWKYSGEDIKFSKWTPNYADWDSRCLVVCFNCNPSYSWNPKDCNTVDSIYVVCHTVTPLKAPTLTTASATTLPVTTPASITTQTGNTPSKNTGSSLAGNKKSTESSPIALAVGVGVGVGVPVIAAIVVIVVCVVRRHKSKTQGDSTTRQESGEEAFHNEYQNNNGEATELDHYATVRSVAPSMPSAVEESTPETQYETLGFKETADQKNGNGQSPLNVL